MQAESRSDKDVPRVEILANVRREDWDQVVVKVGGGFFHSFGHLRFSCALVGAKPLFVEVLGPAGDILAIASGALTESRIWPFSRFCKVACFDSLPACRGESTE